MFCQNTNNSDCFNLLGFFFLYLLSLCRQLKSKYVHQHMYVCLFSLFVVFLSCRSWQQRATSKDLRSLFRSLLLSYSFTAHTCNNNNKR